MSTMTLDQPMVARTAVVRTAGHGAARPTEVRLTRRGRVVVFVVGLVALLALGLLVSTGAGASLHAGTPEPTHTVVVAPGDTLWDIASAAAEGGDVRTMIRHIEDINGLPDASLSVGQSIRVPGRG